MPSMAGMEWVLDSLLVILLTATLFHAVRLERALGVLKRDRAELEALVASFNASTRAAEAGVEHLRAATDGSGRQIQRQIDAAAVLKDDLTFLVQRGEGLADRLDDGVRAARPVLTPPGLSSKAMAPSAMARDEYAAARTAYGSRMGMAPAETASSGFPQEGGNAGRNGGRSGDDVYQETAGGGGRAEAARAGSFQGETSQGPGASRAETSRSGMPNFGAAAREEPKLRSQAERDLLKALRMAR